MKSIHVLASAALAFGALCSGHSFAAIFIENPASGSYKQGMDQPCIIGPASCGDNSFPYHLLSDNDASNSSYFYGSPSYSVSTIRDVLGGYNGFSVGIEVNTAIVTDGYATERLRNFYAVVSGYKNDIYNIDTYSWSGDMQLAVSNVNSPNSDRYADVLIGGFDLTGFAGDATIYFGVTVTEASGDNERFFLINPNKPVDGGSGGDIPEPGILATLGIGMIALGWSRKRGRGRVPASSQHGD